MAEVRKLHRVAGVVLAAALLLLPGLGAIGLWAPDEPRYAQVAEEVRSFEHGARGLLVMHLNGAVYDQKPPLYFWTAALAGTVFGRVTETAARLPSAFAGIACVALLAIFGHAWIGVRAAPLAALLLLTTQEFAHLARRAQLDPLLTLFETGALAAYWWLVRRSDVSHEAVPAPATGVTRATMLMHTCLGLAVLTKGPVGLLIPALVIAVDLALERQLRLLRRLFAPRYALLSIAPGLAWAAASVSLAPAGYFDHAIVDNLFGRFAKGTAHARPWHYFLWNFPISALPWSLVWPALWLEARRAVFVPGADPERARAWRFLLTWIGVTLLFFSLSAGKRSLYLLPALPATALLSADLLARAVDRGSTLGPAAARGLFGLAAIGATAGGALAIAGPWLPVPLPRAVGFAIALLLVATIVAFRQSRTLPAVLASRRRLTIGVASVFGIELVLFAGAFRALDSEKSPRAIAEAAAARVPDGEPIGLLGERGLIGGIAYYGNRRVKAFEHGEDVARYFAEGGRALIARRRDLPRIGEHASVEVVADARRGRRALVVVVPRIASSRDAESGGEITP